MGFPFCQPLGGGLVTKLCLTLITPWTVACHSPLSMGFSRQEYRSGLPFPSPGHLPDPGIELGLLCCRQILYRLNYQGIPVSPLTKWLFLPAILGLPHQVSPSRQHRKATSFQNLRSLLSGKVDRSNLYLVGEPGDHSAADR